MVEHVVSLDYITHPECISRAQPESRDVFSFDPSRFFNQDGTPNDDDAEYLYTGMDEGMLPSSGCILPTHRLPQGLPRKTFGERCYKPTATSENFPPEIAV